eukprot:UN07606
MRLEVRYQPAFFTAKSGHYLRFAPLAAQWLANTGHICSVINNGAAANYDLVMKKGVLFIIVNNDLPLKKLVEIDCQLALTFNAPDNADIKPFAKFNIQAFPKDFYIFDTAAVSMNTDTGN